MSSEPVFRFGAFELDPAAYQLRRAGQVIRLASQPMEVLLLLVERRGELVSREDLGRRLWSEGVFLDRDAGVHTAILKIRQALEEAKPPAFIETVPGRGYRFVAPVRIIERDGTGAPRVSTPPRVDRSATNLPADLTSFIGRETELADVLQLLGTHRLVSVTGAGGCGKTRLVQQAGTAAASRFTQGVWFVDLAKVRDADLVPGAVARTLDLPERPGTAATETVLEWLRPRELLLILDNCEHLVEACAAFVEQVLRGTSRTRVLTTSREALNVPGEMNWRVPPMAFPVAPSTGDALAYDAVRLFVERVNAAAPFALTPALTDVVAEICRRLDGMPLAIELAAARANILSVTEIRDRLHDRFRLLVGGSRTTVTRQRTLEATVDWSYALLTEAERRLLMRLSVFEGGWSLEAAERVCSDNQVSEHDVVDVVSRLADKSLVVVERTLEGSSRYRLLETIRQYAAARLEAAGEKDAVASAHFSYFAEVACRAEPELTGPDQVFWHDRLEVEHGNLRAALDWAAADACRGDLALTLANRLWWFWTKRGYFKEGRLRLERALASSPQASGEARARALIGLVHLISFQGDGEALRALLPLALATARDAHDDWAEAYALNFTAVQEAGDGHFEQSRQLALEARAAARRSTSLYKRQPQGLTWRLLGYWSLQNGDLETAAITFEEAVAFLREAGEIWGLSILLSDLAALRVIQGHYPAARRAADEGLMLAQRLRDRRGAGWSLQSLAMLEAVEGRAARAAWLYGAADALLQSIGATGQVTFSRVQDRYLDPLHEDLGDAAFRAAFDDGRNTPLDRIMEASTGPRDG